MKKKYFATLFFVGSLFFTLVFLSGQAVGQDDPTLSSGGTASIGDLNGNVPSSNENDIDVKAASSLPLLYQRVSGVVFKPRSSTVGWTAGGAGTSSIYATSGSGDVVWNTPVYLPQGAIVKSLRMYYYNTSASDCRGWFTVYDLNGAIVDEWPVDSDSNGGDDYNTTADFDHTINNNSYSYVLNWRPVVVGPTMKLHGFNIFYYGSGTRYGSAMRLSDAP